MLEFNQQCDDFANKLFPGYPYNSASCIVRKSWKQPGYALALKQIKWDFDSYEWLEKDLYEAKLLAYYDSPKWHAKRDARYLHDGYKCVKCGSANIECHHHTYKRVFRELLTDLVTMCRRCHEDIHKEGQRRKGQRA
tara:strand:- start:239 stop:649 length:411 start_codon:yes stop_codon:yes gene_type:complete